MFGDRGHDPLWDWVSGLSLANDRYILYAHATWPDGWDVEYLYEIVTLHPHKDTLRSVLFLGSDPAHRGSGYCVVGDTDQKSFGLRFRVYGAWRARRTNCNFFPWYLKLLPNYCELPLVSRLLVSPAKYIVHTPCWDRDFRKPEIPVHLLWTQLEWPPQKKRLCAKILIHIAQGILPDFWSALSSSQNITTWIQLHI